jgi:hypothetical protein
MPPHMQNSLIFHYNLKFYGDEVPVLYSFFFGDDGRTE